MNKLVGVCKCPLVSVFACTAQRGMQKTTTTTNVCFPGQCFCCYSNFFLKLHFEHPSQRCMSWENKKRNHCWFIVASRKSNTKMEAQSLKTTTKKLNVNITCIIISSPACITINLWQLTQTWFSPSATSLTHGGYPESSQQNTVTAMPHLITEDQQHFLERGEGLNHRCVVCERRHSMFQRGHPPGTPNPFKRKKTQYRCAACKVYLCKVKDRQCWWLWHQGNQKLI